MSVLSEYIQKYLDGQGITQNELARRAGMEKSTMSRIMNEESVTKKQLAKLYPVLGISQKELERLAGFADPVLTPTEIPEESKEEIRKTAEEMREYFDNIIKKLTK